jgi:hypothetical protein
MWLAIVLISFWSFPSIGVIKALYDLLLSWYSWLHVLWDWRRLQAEGKCRSIKWHKVLLSCLAGGMVCWLHRWCLGTWHLSANGAFQPLRVRFMTVMRLIVLLFFLVAFRLEDLKVNTFGGSVMPFWNPWSWFWKLRFYFIFSVSVLFVSIFIW